MKQNLFFKMFLFFLGFTSILTGNPKVHVCTVCNTNNWEYYKKVDISCSSLNIPLNILGQGEQWTANICKWIKMEEFLENIPDEDIILLTDACDIFYLGSLDEIVKKFLKFNAQMVISMEKTFLPSNSIHPFVANTPFNHLNTGGYIGYAGFLKKLTKDLHPYTNDDDQVCLTQYLEKHLELLTNNEIKYDRYAEIFLSLNRLDNKELSLNTIKRRIFCITTNSCPCIFHGNGPAKHFVAKLFLEFFPEESNIHD